MRDTMLRELVRNPRCSFELVDSCAIGIDRGADLATAPRGTIGLRRKKAAELGWSGMQFHARVR